MFRKFLLLTAMTGIWLFTLTSAQAVSLDADPHWGLASGVTQFVEPKMRAEAVALIEGNEFSVASASAYPDPTGTHFHSDDSDSFGVGTDWMEVGGFGEGSEENRGMAEFDMTSAFSVDNATVNFEVMQLGGLFSQPGPGNFTIQLVTYDGNNVEDILDYDIAITSTVTSFGTSGLSVGQFFSFDVTAVYNAAVAAATPAFGIRLQATSDPGADAVVFGVATLGLAVDPPLPPRPHEPVPANTPLGLMALLLLVLTAGFIAVRRRSAS